MRVDINPVHGRFGQDIDPSRFASSSQRAHQLIAGPRRHPVHPSNTVAGIGETLNQAETDVVLLDQPIDRPGGFPGQMADEAVIDLPLGLGLDIGGEHFRAILDPGGALDLAAAGGNQAGRHCRGAERLPVPLDHQHIHPGITHSECRTQTSAAPADDHDGNIGNRIDAVGPDDFDLVQMPGSLPRYHNSISLPDILTGGAEVCSLVD